MWWPPWRPARRWKILFNDPYATAEEMARKSKELGLDQPVIIQYIRWLVQLVQGNMGMSIRTNGQVLDMILERIGPTLILTGSAMALTIIIALPLGFNFSVPQDITVGKGSLSKLPEIAKKTWR